MSSRRYREDASPWEFKDPFCDPNMFFMIHVSVDMIERFNIDNISLFPNFQSILTSHLRVMHMIYCMGMGGMMLWITKWTFHFNFIRVGIF